MDRLSAFGGDEPPHEHPCLWRKCKSCGADTAWINGGWRARGGKSGPRAA